MAQQRFENVTFVKKGTTSNLGDRGSVTLLPDGVEFDGKKVKVTLRGIRVVELEKVPGGFGAVRIRVTSTTPAGLEDSYFAERLNTPSSRRRLGELSRALQATHGGTPLNESDKQRMAVHEGVVRGAKLKSARRNMWIGGVLAVAGLLVTLITYSAASSSSSGGTYFVAYGPMIFGVVLFITGLVESRSASKANASAAPAVTTQPAASNQGGAPARPAAPPMPGGPQTGPAAQPGQAPGGTPPAPPPPPPPE
jgi:hypothetical protein